MFCSVRYKIKPMNPDGNIGLMEALFDALEGFDHVDLSESEEHAEVDDTGKESGHQNAGQITHRLNDSAEHDHIQFKRADDVAVKRHAEQYAGGNAEQRQNFCILNCPLPHHESIDVINSHKVDI